MPIAPNPSEEHVGQVGGSTVAVKATFTRPNNTTAYAQYDIVAAQASGVSVIFMSFAGAGRVVNGSGYITKARLETNRATEAGSYRLFIYRKPSASLTTPLTNLGDNDLFPMTFANSDDRIGHIDFANWITGGSGSDSSVCVMPDVRLAYGCASDSSTIYALLICNVAVTPAALQQFAAYITFEQN